MSNIHNPEAGAAPGTSYEITWDNTLVYQGQPAVWTEFDCHVGAAVVLLRAYVMNDGTTAQMSFKKAGTGDEATGVGGASVYFQSGSAIANQVGFLCVPTDARGFLSVKGTHFGGDLYVYRIGYIKCPMPRTTWHGAESPLAWADLNLGVKNALCFLRLQRLATGAGQYAYFRTNGETLEAATSSYDVGTYAYFDDAAESYVVVLSDENGLVEWYSSWAYEYRITLEAYVPVKDLVQETLCSGDIPAAWTEVTSSLGKSLILAKGVGSADTSWGVFRPHDESLDNTSRIGMGWIPSHNGELATGLVLTIDNGSFEWEEAGAGDLTVTKLARLV